jgi:putative ABC transport system permease protein
VMISLSNGVSNAIINEIGELGSNFFQADIYDNSGLLSYQDVEDIKKNTNNISSVSIIKEFYVDMEIKNEKTKIHVGGIQPDLFDIAKQKVTFGRALKKQDMENKSRVAFISYELATKLFNNPKKSIGQLIRIHNTDFQIIGVREKQTFGVLQLGDIWIPYTVYVELYKSDKISCIMANAKSPETMTFAMEELGDYLYSKYNNDKAYKVSTQTTIMDTISSVLQIVKFLIIGIAMISLLVGGIGIMNIMLVYVTERRKEIGIRKAIGSSRFNILLQFLLEAGIITGIGCVIGIILSSILVKVLSIIGSQYNMTFKVSMESLILSVFCASFISLIFAYIPAYKAAKLQPIKALKSN